MKRRIQALTALTGVLAAILGGVSLLKSRSKSQGKARLTLMVLGLSLLPLSFLFYEKSRD